MQLTEAQWQYLFEPVQTIPVFTAHLTKTILPLYLKYTDVWTTLSVQLHPLT